jgi:hypothetical protein
MTKKQNHPFAASVTFHDPADYTEQGMRDIAAWLRRIARDVQRYRRSGKLGKRFSARYYYDRTSLIDVAKQSRSKRLKALVAAANEPLPAVVDLPMKPMRAGQSHTYKPKTKLPRLPAELVCRGKD